MPALTCFLALGSIAEGSFTFTELTRTGAYASPVHKSFACGRWSYPK